MVLYEFSETFEHAINREGRVVSRRQEAATPSWQPSGTDNRARRYRVIVIGPTLDAALAFDPRT